MMAEGPEDAFDKAWFRELMSRKAPERQRFLQLASIGNVEVHSRLGQPLHAVMPLVGTGVFTEGGSSTFTLTAPREVLETAGVLSQPFRRVA